MLRRCFSHLTTTRLTLRRCFPAQLLADIDAAITASEQTHRAEIRFAIETALPIAQLWRGVSCRERARELFGELGMAGTAGHNGILVYVLLAERAVEIVADRGFGDKVPASVWEEICIDMAVAFGRGDFGSGARQSIRRLNALAAASFPPGVDDRDELPNQSVLL